MSVSTGLQNTAQGVLLLVTIHLQLSPVQNFKDQQRWTWIQISDRSFIVFYLGCGPKSPGDFEKKKKKIEKEKKKQGILSHRQFRYCLYKAMRKKVNYLSLSILAERLSSAASQVSVLIHRKVVGTRKHPLTLSLNLENKEVATQPVVLWFHVKSTEICLCHGGWFKHHEQIQFSRTSTTSSKSLTREVKYEKPLRDWI